MDDKDLIERAEKILLTSLDSLKAIERTASNIENQIKELENECNSKKSFLKTLNEDFNSDRNDLRTFGHIQRDFVIEAYIKQLENTMELVMSKYRGHTQYKIDKTKLDFDELREKFKECDCIRTINKQNDVINGLVEMMRDFVNEGCETTNKLVAENAELRAEVKTLRDIAKVVEKFEIKDINNN